MTCQRRIAEGAAYVQVQSSFDARKIVFDTNVPVTLGVDSQRQGGER